VIEMLFDRTKLHEFRLWYHFGYFRYLPNLMQKIGIALPSCIRQRALLLHWPGSWLLVGLERPKQVIPTETTGATDKERNGSSGPLYSVHAPFGERVSAGLLVQRSNCTNATVLDTKPTQAE
jgi:hypothetical protein